MKFFSIDPGAPTGITFWLTYATPAWSMTVREKDAQKYIKALNVLADIHKPEFAIIEDYATFASGPKSVNRTRVSFNVVGQIYCLKSVFKNHVMVHTSQWNGQRWNDKTKKAMVKDIYLFDGCRNKEEVDSFLLGAKIMEKVRFRVGSIPGAMRGMFMLAQGGGKFPRQSDPSPWHDLEREAQKLDIPITMVDGVS